MEYNTESVNCNLCGSEDKDLITKDKNYDSSLKLVLCKNCGLGYLSPRWTQEAYNEYYQSSYDAKYRSGIKKSASTETVSSPLIKRLESSGNLSKEFKSVLDIGCGAGDNLVGISTKLNEAHLFGIEPSLNAKQMLKNRGIELISSDVNSGWDLENNKRFDLIIMRHVLEHFLDPRDVLSRVRETLSDEGVLYLAVPNNLKPIHNLRKKWFRVVHTYYFNKFTLKNLMVSCGYEVLDIEENDGLSRGEVFVIVRKAEKAGEMNVSEEHYQLQKKAFEEREKYDSLFVNKVKDYRRAITKRLFSK